MKYKMSDRRWESVMGYIRESIKHPESTPDDVLLLALSGSELRKLFTRRRVELLKIIRERPQTLSTIAKRTGRELSAVQRDVRALEEIGVIALTKEGREVTPRITKELIVLPLVAPLTLKELAA